MSVQECLNNNKVSISFEFFPPKTDKGWETLFRTVSELVPLQPAYVSITYGAGGSTREFTHDLVVRIQRETGIPVVAHLTCVAATRAEIHETLQRYRDNGITHILALRGDLPKTLTESEATPADGFEHAVDLVAFIKEHFPEMGVGVAGFPEGHPLMPNRLQEMAFLKAKIDAGADWLVTQLFFDNRDFYDFRERCAFYGIEAPIIPGIMPITSRRNMYRIADLAGGSRIPAPLMKAVWRAQSDDYVTNVGIHWAAEQVRDLIEHGVPGIHFYTLNHSRASVEICHILGLQDFHDVSASVSVETTEFNAPPA